MRKGGGAQLIVKLLHNALSKLWGRVAELEPVPAYVFTFTQDERREGSTDFCNWVTTPKSYGVHNV